MSIYLHLTAITYSPCGGLEDDPSNGADTQEEEINLLKNHLSSRSPLQRMPSLSASPLVKVTGKFYPWYCCQLLKIVRVQYHVPIAQVI